MDNSKVRQQNEPLGVNKIGKNIRKSPLHQPNFVNNSDRQQTQPQVYNISKNDFRNIVQQLTGSPSQQPLSRPSQTSPKPQNMRLQKIKPPPLSPISKPQVPTPVPDPAEVPSLPPVIDKFLIRPGQFGHPSPATMLPMAPRHLASVNTAESPVSAYMRYLQNSMMDHSPKGNQAQPTIQPRSPGPGHIQSPRPLPSSGSFPHLHMPSPTGYLNMLSPWSSNPLFPPTVQFPPPLTPNFPISPMAQSGILASGLQTPSSPGFIFPSSPTGLFPLSNPIWRDQYSRK